MSTVTTHHPIGHSTAALDQLVAGIAATVRRPAAARAPAVARLTAQALRAPGLLTPEQREASEEHYRTNLLHVADDGAFSVVALVWLPGQRTPIHSHRSWCVVGVYEGVELEGTYEAVPGGARLVSTRTWGPGSVTWAAAERDLHHVENAGDDVAISIHVYGCDYGRLGSSILEVFEERPVRTPSGAEDARSRRAARRRRPPRPRGR